MALSIGDTLRIVFGGILYGQSWEFSTFRSLVAGDGTPTYDGILDLAAGRYTTGLAPVIAGNCVLTSITVENLTNELDILERVVNVVGLNQTTNAMPAFVAYGVQILRESRLTRHGAARVPGVPEAAFESGNVILSQALKDGVANFFGQQWQVTTGPAPDYTLVPVIVGRSLVTVGDKQYYDYDLTRINPVVGASFRGVTTQNSRKN
jgi:hypothetical protein